MNDWGVAANCHKGLCHLRFVQDRFEMPLADNLDSIAIQGLNLIEDCRLRDSLIEVYHSPEAVRVTETAHRVFTKLMESEWQKDTLATFVSGWRDTHVTALYVAGLIIRLHREAAEADERGRQLLLRAASEVCEIIPEDTGVDDVPHEERFCVFANELIGNDRWKLDRYQVECCAQFRLSIKKARISGPVEEAILYTAASENWNSGEYTYLNNRMLSWMVDILGRPSQRAESSLAYVAVHAGETELRHFLHALKAWQLYCQAHGRAADPKKAQEVFSSYIRNLGGALDGLEHVFADQLSFERSDRIELVQ